MAYEDQRDAREADVAGGHRRTTKRAEGSDDPRDEPVDGFLRSKGIRFVEAACQTHLRAPADFCFGRRAPNGARDLLMGRRF